MSDRYDQSQFSNGAGNAGTQTPPTWQSAPANQAPVQQQPQVYPYQQQASHISQEPINDVEAPYVTRERYMTLEEQEQGQRQRVHMGTATSNPSYLQETEFQRQIDAQRRPAHPIAEKADASKPRALTNSSRYLQTPKPGRSIFVSERTRQQRRRKVQILAGVICIVAIVLVWFFFIR